MSGNHYIFGARTDFSLGESTLQVKRLVSAAKELGAESVALTDTMNVSGMVEFCNEATKAGIKPLVGCTLRVYQDPAYRKPKKGSGEVEKPNPSFQMKVFVRNDEGLRWVLALLSKANSAAYFYYHSRVGVEDLVTAPKDSVFFTTGDLFNVFHMGPEKSREIVTRLGFCNPVFVELVPINTPLFDRLNQDALALAVSMDLPMIASRPAYYETPEHADSLDVLRAICTQEQMSSRWLPIPFVRDMSLITTGRFLEEVDGMLTRLGVVCKEDALKKLLYTNEAFAEGQRYEFKKLKPSLPKMAENEFVELVKRCKEGWARRFSAPVMGHQPSPSDLTTYRDRLAYELSVLQKLEFAGYFLLTQEIVRWSKSNGILVGPGRGSSGGSLVAYLMGITDVDPIRFDLLFERFINPSRLDLPDADLDFMSSRRQEVVEYIKGRFGEDRVAAISNYSTLGPALAIRDVSRVHGLSPLDYTCSKQVEKEHGVSLSLEESAESVPDIAKFKSEHPIIWKHATTLEGRMRNLGQHAAGVVVAGEPVINRAVVETREGAVLPVVSWDKRVVEDWGLIKMDVLGLSTLDVLFHALRYIKERHGHEVNLLDVPLDEPDILLQFEKGNTGGVFQFEGCLAGDVDVDGMSIAERYKQRILGELRSYNEERNELRKGHVHNVIYSGKQITYTLKLKDGKSLRLTENHPVYVKEKGWTKLKDVKSGDLILTA